jgi:hypothetical protein
VSPAVERENESQWYKITNFLPLVTATLWIVKRTCYGRCQERKVHISQSQSRTARYGTREGRFFIRFSSLLVIVIIIGEFNQMSLLLSYLSTQVM